MEWPSFNSIFWALELILTHSSDLQDSLFVLSEGSEQCKKYSSKCVWLISNQWYGGGAGYSSILLIRKELAPVHLFLYKRELVRNSYTVTTKCFYLINFVIGILHSLFKSLQETVHWPILEQKTWGVYFLSFCCYEEDSHCSYTMRQSRVFQSLQWSSLLLFHFYLAHFF